MQLYLLGKDGLLIIRNKLEKRNDITWDLPYPLRHHLVSARYRVSFSIHTPISDRVSRLLLKIVQTDCR